MPLIQFPDVPRVPGVPPLVRSGLNAILAVTGGLALLDSLGLPSDTLTPVWGLFDSAGKPVFVVQSVVSFGMQNSSPVSKFPIERGSFNSYNKSGTPYEARMVISQGGTQAEREALTTALDTASRSTALYTIVTPDATYFDANIEDYSYNRTATDGAGMIVAELKFTEIRQTAIAQFSTSGGSQGTPIPSSQTNSDSAASPESIGQVQAVEPTADELSFAGDVA